MQWITSIFLFSCLLNFVASTVISNLNVVFETFSPLSMVRFFEFNDNGWNITEDCIKDMFLYLDALHKDVLWAVKCMTQITSCVILFIIIILLPIIHSNKHMIWSKAKLFGIYITSVWRFFSFIRQQLIRNVVVH